MDRLGIPSAVAAQAQLVKTCHTHVQANKGIIAFVHGDHVFAAFNAASSCAAHSRRAAIAALAIRDELAEHSSLVQGTVTMGIDSSVAAVGAMGSSELKSFAIVGSCVQRAQMLERLCDIYEQCQILLPSNLAAELGADFTHRGVDILRDEKELRAQVQDALQRQSKEKERVSLSTDGTSSSSVEDEDGGSSSASLVGLDCGVYSVSSLEAMTSSGTVDNEWMYELQQNEKEDPYKTVNQCFGFLVAGSASLEAANKSIAAAVALLKLPPQPILCSTRATISAANYSGGDGEVTTRPSLLSAAVLNPLTGMTSSALSQSTASSVTSSSSTTTQPGYIDTSKRTPQPSLVCADMVATVSTSKVGDDALQLSIEHLKECMSRPGVPLEGILPNWTSGNDGGNNFSLRFGGGSSLGGRG